MLRLVFIGSFWTAAMISILFALNWAIGVEIIHGQTRAYCGAVVLPVYTGRISFLFFQLLERLGGTLGR